MRRATHVLPVRIAHVAYLAGWLAGWHRRTATVRSLQKLGKNSEHRRTATVRCA